MTNRPICPAVVPPPPRFAIWAALACLCGLGIPAGLALASLLILLAEAGAWIGTL